MPNAAVDPSLAISTEPATDLLSFIEASPSPYAVCETVAARLSEHGFKPQPIDEPFAGGGSWFTIIGGSLIAWIEPDNADPDAPFTIIGAHTDSPNLRIKPLPDDGSAGFRQVGFDFRAHVELCVEVVQSDKPLIKTSRFALNEFLHLRPTRL